jgi:hypothetical protein
MVAELSKALCLIATALPRVEAQLNLYQTAEMRAYVEKLYAEIIQFYQRALKWYDGGKLKHLVGSFIGPYALRFQDLVCRINESARNIEIMAAVYAQLELRDLLTLTQSSTKNHVDMASLLLDIRRMLIGKR